MEFKSLDEVERFHSRLTRLYAHTPPENRQKIYPITEYFIRKAISFGSRLSDVDQRDDVRSTAAFWNFYVLDGKLNVDLGPLPE